MELQREAQQRPAASAGLDAVGTVGGQPGRGDLFGETVVGAGLERLEGLFMGPGVPVGLRWTWHDSRWTTNIYRRSAAPAAGAADPTPRGAQASTLGSIDRAIASSFSS